MTPTEEELFSRYNPELQRRSLENRRQKQEDFDQFVRKLKEYSKSDKPIWEAAAEDDEREREGQRRAQRELVQEEERVKEERKAQMREALRK